MFAMGSRGQGFDVFKLLIAAVVAGAILLILLQTLQVLPSIGSQNPNSSAANAVKSKINDPGSVQFLKVTFNKDDSLSARTIVSQSSGLGEDQLCVLKGKDVPNTSNFRLGAGTGESAGKVLIYNGSFAQKARLLVLCDRQSEINKDLSAYGYNSGGSEPHIESEISSSNCGGFSSTGTSTYCIVAVVAEQ